MTLTSESMAAAEKDSRCLMVVLHGLGDSLEGYRWLPSVLRLPWMNYLLVNAPDLYYGGFSWYDFANDPAPGVRRSYRSLAAILDQQRAQGFPSEQTWVFGFSQGCLMTIETGTRYPHRLAGLIGISGHVHRPEMLVGELSAVARQQKFLITHGTSDPLIPIAPVRQEIGLLQEAGLQIQWREFAKAHTIEGEREIEAIRRFIEETRPGG